MLDTHIEHERDDAQHSDHKSDKKDLHHWILTDLFSKMLILSGLFWDQCTWYKMVKKFENGHCALQRVSAISDQQYLIEFMGKCTPRQCLCCHAMHKKSICYGQTLEMSSESS